MDDSFPQTHYMTLDVPHNASLGTIGRAHVKLLSFDISAESKNQIQQAYEVLSDEGKRLRYDEAIRMAKLRAEKTDFPSSKNGPTAKSESQYDTMCIKFQEAAIRKNEPDLSSARCTDDPPYPYQAYPIQSYPTQAYPIQSYPTQAYPIQSYSTQALSPIYTGSSSSGHPVHRISSKGSTDSGYATKRPSVASKEARLSTPRPSSPSEYACLHPDCGHISSRAHDLKCHMTKHFPPTVDELLDCKYEWCGRTGAYGFKRETHRKEHYRKVHMKETGYPKTGKGSRSGRNIWGRPDISAPPTTYIPVVPGNEKNPAQTKATEDERTLEAYRVPPSGDPPISGLSTEAVAPSSLIEYPCLHPDCGHISSRAHDLKRHMTKHFPPTVDELLECKYKWCERTGAYGFKRDDHRKEHYRRMHMKESEYPETGKGSRSERKATEGERTVEAYRVPPSGDPQIPGLSTEAVAPIGSQQPFNIHETLPGREIVGLKVSVPDSDVVRSTASDAHNVRPIEWSASSSDDVEMVLAKGKGLNSCSDNESMHEQFENGIFDKSGTYAKCEYSSPLETISDRDKAVFTPMSRPSVKDKLIFIKNLMLETVLADELGQYYASLNIEWDILAFMKDQFPEHDFPNVKLDPVITISGSVQHAQADTCSEYIRQNWPAHGSMVLDGLQDALNTPTRTSRASFITCNNDGSVSGDAVPSSHAELEFDVTQGNVRLNIKSGTADVIVDVVQQLVWMGTALRTSADGRVQYCEPKIAGGSKAKGGEPIVLNITFDMSTPGKQDQSCWLSLFANPVIARGFPVPERENGERGLEVPLEMMAALGGARHVTDFEGGLILKGHSAMFIPVKRHHQSIQWHMIRRSDEHRILYREVRDECPNRTLLEEVDHESLRNTRAFLGWWKSAETHLGTADAAYTSIDWSPACDARRPTRCSGGNIGFSHVITGQLSFVPGVKDGRLHFSQKGPFQRIVRCAANTPVVLYDQADRRAWFVPGLDLMLHIVQTRHHLSPYKVDGKTVGLTPVSPGKGRGAAMEAVAANKSRQLYERDVAAEKSYHYQDAILDIWSQIELLMEKKDSIDAGTGLALHGTMQDKVHGWEYMSLVHERNYRQKEATVRKSSGGWVDLINDIDALVLFATGLDEIIRPVCDLSNLCHHWKTLPKGKDFLAASIPMLELLYSEAGSRLSRKHLSTSHLQWHRGWTLFEECNDMALNRCRCDRTQQIYHDSLFKTFGHVRPPGILKENGCVIFGQAHHPFRPRQVFPTRQNTVYMLPNTPIQDGGTIRQSPINDYCLLSPSHPAAVLPEPDEVNDFEAQDRKRAPSLPRFTKDLVDNNNAALKRRRKMSHIRLPESKLDKGRDSCNGETSVTEDYATCSTEHEPVLEGETQVQKAQEVASTQTVCAPNDEHDAVHIRRTVHREEMIGHYSHPYRCVCTACLVVDFEPPGSIGLVNTSTGTRRNPTNIAERRERQTV